MKLQRFVKTLEAKGVVVLPSASKIAITVGESGAVLFEVAVERGGKALKADAERLLEAFQYGDGQGGLGVLAVCAGRVRRGVDAQEGGVALEHHPHARDKQFELAVVETAVSVQMLLQT